MSSSWLVEKVSVEKTSVEICPGANPAPYVGLWLGWTILIVNHEKEIACPSFKTLNEQKGQL